MKLLDKDGLTYYTNKVKEKLNTKENTSNKVTSISSSSTNTQYPSAKCIYDSQATQDTKITNLENQVFGDETIEGEGTSLTLDGTLKGQFNSIDLKGNTSQDGTPTPTSPIPVNVVSGDNKIFVNSKNHLRNDIQTQTINGVTITRNDDDSLTLNGTSSAGTRVYFTDSNVDIPKGTYTASVHKSGTLSGGTAYISYQASGTDLLGLNISSSNNKTITLDADTNGIFSIYFSNGRTFTNFKIYPMLELGTSVTDYEPYQGDTYNIDLPEGIELCKIGTYQDYFYKDSGKWYLHKEIGKYNEWASVNARTAYTNTTRFQFILTYPTTSAKRAYLLSNYFRNAINNDDTEHLFVGTGTPNVYDGLNVFISNSRATTSEEAINWLQTNGVAVYYALETPTTTEITDTTLLDQLNELEKAISYEGQTNISQVNNDLPFIISASAFLNNINGKIALLNKLTEV